MNGQSHSIPFGMAFKKKYYCSRCGARLEKEKTHRIVTSSDKDYYQYHKAGQYPKCDYNVFDYRFKCPSCEARIAYEEQCIIEKIQKKQGRSRLSTVEIKENYEECKAKRSKEVLIRNILIPVLFFFFCFALYLLIGTNRGVEILGLFSILMILIIVETLILTIIKHKGKGRLKYSRTYSYEKECMMKKLHAYSSHNRSMIERSKRCYCFNCMHIMDSSDIEVYIDGDQTALCPECSIDSIIPDCVDEELNDGVISEMNKYWF